MQVVLHNIQAIPDTTLEFPDTGIVEFVGNNSNGKSVLEKIITGIVSLNIKDRVVRESLISDDAEEGFVVMLYGNKSLSVRIHSERDKTLFQYIPNLNDISSKVERTLREGGIEDIITDFGFRTYGNGALCTQIYPTFGMMPFINAPDSINGEIVEDVTHDKMADTFLSNYKDKTYPMAKVSIAGRKKRKIEIENELSSMRLYDHVSYEKLKVKIDECLHFLDHFVSLELKPATVPLDIKTFDVPKLTLSPYTFATTVPDGMKVCPATTVLDNYLQALEGKCPTCGKLIFEEEIGNV